MPANQKAAGVRVTSCQFSVQLAEQPRKQTVETTAQHKQEVKLAQCCLFSLLAWHGASAISESSSRPLVNCADYNLGMNE